MIYIGGLSIQYQSSEDCPIDISEGCPCNINRRRIVQLIYRRVVHVISIVGGLSN